MKEVTDKTFKEEVLNNKETTIVFFWAAWEPRCSNYKAILDKIAEEKRLKVVGLDVDFNTETPAKYSIVGIPTFLIFKNGEPSKEIIGFLPKVELRRVILENI
jgi:thioredoxin 1